MKLTNIGEVNDLIATVEHCKGEVWLESVDGDKLSLTSSFSRYVAIGSLIKDKAEQLELFCELPEDEAKFMFLFSEHPDIF